MITEHFEPIATATRFLKSNFRTFNLSILQPAASDLSNFHLPNFQPVTLHAVELLHEHISQLIRFEIPSTSSEFLCLTFLKYRIRQNNYKCSISILRSTHSHVQLLFEIKSTNCCKHSHKSRIITFLHAQNDNPVRL